MRQWVGKRESEGQNTDQFPGDGHEKILDVCRGRLRALTCGAWVRARREHCGDDVALLGALRIVSRISLSLGDCHEKDSPNSGRGLPVDHWHSADSGLCV